ncbi:MAG: hypothetical protein O9284_17900 [Steroidobacteraceae bacterium]|jgi:hypothetical protein|nr:hypothetical protein [Steroidobacteraceae bacterium]
MTRSVPFAAVVAGVLAVGTAQAAFINGDVQPPARSTPSAPAGNDFTTQLAGGGLGSLFVSSSLALDQAGTVNAQYVGK